MDKNNHKTEESQPQKKGDHHREEIKRKRGDHLGRSSKRNKGARSKSASKRRGLGKKTVFWRSFYDFKAVESWACCRRADIEAECARPFRRRGGSASRLPKCCIPLLFLSSIRGCRMPFRKPSTLRQEFSPCTRRAILQP